MKEYGNSLVAERDLLKKKNKELIEEFEKIKNDPLYVDKYTTPKNEISNAFNNQNLQTSNGISDTTNTTDNTNEYFIHTISDQKLKMDRLNEEINKVVEEKKKIEEDFDIFRTKMKKLEDEINM